MRLPAIAQGARRRLLARLIANGFGQALMTVAAVLLVRESFDRLVATSAEPSAMRISLFGGALVATAAINAWLRLTERVDAERLGQDYVREVRSLLFSHLSRLSPRQAQRRSTGAVMLRFVGDLTALRQWISAGFARLAISGLASVIAVATLIVLDPMIGIAVGAVMIGAGALGLWLGPRIQKAAREARHHRARIAANINDKIAHVAVVQVFGQALRERRRVDRQGQRLMDAMVGRAWRIGQLRALTEAATAIATAAVMVVGAFGVAGGRTELGVVVAAILVAGLLAPRLRDLGRAYEYWNGAQVSREKLRQFLATPAMLDEAGTRDDLETRAGRLAFEAVGYQDCLAGVTAIAAPGARVALVGPNGAGKSTLLALVARLIEPGRGRILLDGQDIARYRLASVRRAVAMVGPDLPLIRGSIDRNLRYGGRAASDAEVARIAALCGVDRIVAELPDGLRTRIVGGGANLSAGQRQCIALARALLRAPAVLLLDEADANLDPRMSAALDRVLADFGGTVLMITHDPRRLAEASEVWHLDDGRIVERGAPAALLAGDGPTARLFRPDAPRAA